MSLQAKMAAESIQDADLSFLSNYVHHSNRRGLSSFNGLQARKVDPTVGTIVHTNTTSFMAPKLLQHNLLAAVSSPYLTELTGIFTIASFLHPGEILCSVCGIWYILCLPSGFLLLTIYSICNLTDTSWGTFIIILLFHYYR